MARNSRGAVGTFGGYARGFGQRTKHSFSSLKQLFHGYPWGLAAGFALLGYYIPQTLTNLGAGWILYDRIPQYAAVVDSGYQAVYNMGVPDALNPWQNGGLMGFGKLTGAGYAAKQGYDFEHTGKISRGAMVAGLPMALGLILDGPELNPMSGQVDGGSWGAGQGGVAW